MGLEGRRSASARLAVWVAILGAGWIHEAQAQEPGFHRH